METDTHPMILALYRRFKKSHPNMIMEDIDRIVILQFTLEHLEESYKDYNEVVIDEDHKYPWYQVRKELRKELAFRKLQL